MSAGELTVFKSKDLSYCLVGDLSPHDVKPVSYCRILPGRPLVTFVGHFQDVRETGIGQGIGGGPAYCPRHIGNAVVDYLVYLINWVAVGSGSAGLHTEIGRASCRGR